MRVSVIVATLSGREQSLARTLRTLAATLPAEDGEVLLAPNFPSCSEGWQWGAEQAQGDFLHLTCDDLEYLPGWWEAATAVCVAGAIPAPLILNSDGSVQSCGETMDATEPDGSPTTLARVAPTLSREQWEAIQPLPPIHYFIENWIARRAAELDVPILVCHGFTFIHHLDMSGVAQEVPWPERLAADRGRFEELIVEEGK